MSGIPQKQRGTDIGQESRNLLVLNGTTVVSDQIGSEQFLREYPSGAYTTMRTMSVLAQGDELNHAKFGIFMYERHVKRLADSCSVMMQDQEKTRYSAEKSEQFDREVKSLLCDAQRLESVVSPCIRKAIDHYLDRYGDRGTFAAQDNGSNGSNGSNGNSNNNNAIPPHHNVNAGELKISQLITWSHTERQYALYTHVCELPMRPTVPVVCDIRRGSRADVKGKDSAWVVQRKKLWQNTTPEANEIIMCEDDGSVREGVSSNFFVILDDGTIVTACEDIVQGTVMQLVSKVCQELGIKIEYRPAGPRLHELARWREAFITSTSRLVLPISTLVIGADCMEDFSELRNDDHFMKLLSTDESLNVGEYRFDLPSTDLTGKLFGAVQRHMQDMSALL